jgi:hypothetical protein
MDRGQACASFVMAGPVPAIHVLSGNCRKSVDARDKPRHDEPEKFRLLHRSRAGLAGDGVLVAGGAAAAAKAVADLPGGPETFA